jgi:hypothetical protein
MENDPAAVRVVCLDGWRLSQNESLRNRCAAVLQKWPGHAIFCHPGGALRLTQAAEWLKPVRVADGHEHHTFHSRRVEVIGCLPRMLRAGSDEEFETELVRLDRVLRTRASDLLHVAMHANQHGLCALEMELQALAGADELGPALEAFREKWKTPRTLIDCLDEAQRRVLVTVEEIEPNWRVGTASARTECEQFLVIVMTGSMDEVRLALAARSNPVRTLIGCGERVIEDRFCSSNWVPSGPTE